jgi:signal transduction histidine kinase
MLIYLYYETPGMKRMGGTGAAYVIWGSAVVLANAVLIPLYLMLVRKIKCKLMWKGSITKWCVAKVKSGIIDVYDNGQLVIRTWLPYLLFLAFNLVLVLLGVGGIIIAFIIDILVGLLLYHETKTRNDIVAGISRISGGELAHKIDTSKMHGDNLALANAVNNIGDGISKAVNTSMRDEKMKADLITNVSHDIKTPLTSIISYVDLIKRENIQDEKIKGYVDILDQKSQRLKALTDDLVEASKISSGAVVYKMERINFVELINQSLGEYSEKFKDKGLDFITKVPEKAVYIKADARGMYRIIENLYNNICKYALENTRVYGDMVEDKGKVSLCIKNISAEPLNITTEELMERFTRGDVSRKTEGSGLGLSIAKNLTEAMGGEFKLELDGDLFKATVVFNTVE